MQIAILRYQRRPQDNRLCCGLNIHTFYRGRELWVFVGWLAEEPAPPPPPPPPSPEPQPLANRLQAPTEAPPETLPGLFLVSPGREDAAQRGLRHLPTTELQSAFDRTRVELQELKRVRQLSPTQRKQRLEATTGQAVLAAELRRRGIPSAAHAERRRPTDGDTSDPVIVRRRKRDDQNEL